MNFSDYKVVVVGSGFFGSVIAERIAHVLDLPVLIIEKREHIGGNCYSEIESSSGIEYHKYGSHIFHTSHPEIWSYINRFTSFNNYKHRILSSYRGENYKIPVNLQTINSFYKKSMNSDEARNFLLTEISKSGNLAKDNFEGKAISVYGKKIYEAFLKGYTEKHWGTELHKLPASIINRLQLRFDEVDTYFHDRFEGIPTGGYHEIFKRMLKHPKISVIRNTDFFTVKEKLHKDTLIIYTGPIDRFFNYKYGLLGWRTLDFVSEILDINFYQKVAIINYPEKEVPYTRIHEFKHYHPERIHPENKTLIYKEYPKKAEILDEPYYPVNTKEDKEKLQLYQKESASFDNVIFGGRLATYKYLNMDQVIGSALHCFDKKIKPKLC